MYVDHLFPVMSALGGPTKTDNPCQPHRRRCSRLEQSLEVMGSEEQALSDALTQLQILNAATASISARLQSTIADGGESAFDAGEEESDFDDGDGLDLEQCILRLQEMSEPREERDRPSSGDELDLEQCILRLQEMSGRIDALPVHSLLDARIELDMQDAGYATAAAGPLGAQPAAPLPPPLMPPQPLSPGRARRRSREGLVDLPAVPEDPEAERAAAAEAAVEACEPSSPANLDDLRRRLRCLDTAEAGFMMAGAEAAVRAAVKDAEQRRDEIDAMGGTREGSGGEEEEEEEASSGSEGEEQYGYAAPRDEGDDDDDDDDDEAAAEAAVAAAAEAAMAEDGARQRNPPRRPKVSAVPPRSPLPRRALPLPSLPLRLPSALLSPSSPPHPQNKNKLDPNQSATGQSGPSVPRHPTS